MRRVVKNFVTVLSGDAARRIIGFVTFAILARRIGAAGFGMLSLAFTVFSYGAVISSAGLHLLGTREIAAGNAAAELADTIAERTAQFVGRMIGARLMLSVISLILIGLASLFVREATQAWLIALVSLALIPQALFLDWYFQGTEEMAKPVAARLLSALVYLAVVSLLVHGVGDLLWAGFGAVAGDIAAMMLFFRFYRNESLVVRFEPAEWIAHLKKSFPIAAGSIFGFLSINYPVIAIGLFMSAADVGMYSAAGKLVIALLMLDRVISALLVPASARLYASSPERFARELQTALKWVLILGLPAVVAASILAPVIVPLVYGAGYDGAIAVLRISVWFFLLTMLHTVYTAGVLAVRQEVRYGKIMAVSALLYFAGVTAGVYAAGLTGAAAAVVVAEMITMLLMRDALNRHLRIAFPRGVMRTIGAAAVTGSILWFVPTMTMPGALALAVVAYPVLLFATKVVTLEEIQLLFKRPEIA